MVGFEHRELGALTENQIQAIVSHFEENWLSKARSEDAIQDFQEKETFAADANTEDGEQLFLKNCATCHSTKALPSSMAANILHHSFIGYTEESYLEIDSSNAPGIREFSEDAQALAVSNTMIRETILHGRASMPSFRRDKTAGSSLSTIEVDSIIMFMRNYDYQQELAKLRSTSQ